MAHNSEFSEGLFDKSQTLVAHVRRTLWKCRSEQGLERTYPRQCDQTEGYSNEIVVAITSKSRRSISYPAQRAQLESRRTCVS